jgi:uncharacterized protein YodC (DUF2158 family)
MEEKVFFTPGDVVELRQSIQNKPEMVVASVDKSTFKEGKSVLFGVTCFWFTEAGMIQEKRFNTKDLKHVEGD